MSDISESSSTAKAHTPQKRPSQIQMKAWDEVAAVHESLVSEALVQGQSLNIIEDLDDSILVDPTEYQSPPRIHIPRDVSIREVIPTSEDPITVTQRDPGVVDFLIPLQDEIDQEVYDRIVMGVMLKLEHLNVLTIGGATPTPHGLKVQIKKQTLIPSSGTSSSDDDIGLKSPEDIQQAILTSKQQTKYYQTRDQARDLAASIVCPIKMTTHMGASMFVNWRKIISDPEHDFLQTALEMGPDKFQTLPDDCKVYKVIMHSYPKNPILRNLSMDYFAK